MVARISAAEARKLGLDNVPAARKRTTRKTAKGPYRTRCHGCGQEFTTMASEDRHVAAGHNRYDLVLS